MLKVSNINAQAVIPDEGCGSLGSPTINVSVGFESREINKHKNSMREFLNR